MNSNDPSAAGKASKLMFWMLMVFALFYLVTEHRAHLFGWLPFMIVLACPLMHVFMHGGHGHRGHGHGGDIGASRPENAGPVTDTTPQDHEAQARSNHTRHR